MEQWPVTYLNLIISIKSDRRKKTLPPKLQGF
jgi:hypothetical protein